MKKMTAYLAIFLLTMSMAFAASVSRSLPGRADPNSELTVKLQISGADSSGLLTLEEVLPEGMTVKDWTISGAKEEKSAISTRIVDNRYGWSFTPSGSSATIEYTIDLGSSDASFGSLVFFDKAGQGNIAAQTLRVAAVTCGDGTCEGGENSDNCEADCPKAAPPAEPTPTEEPKPIEAPSKTSWPGWATFLVIVVVGLVVYFVFVKKKKE